MKKKIIKYLTTMTSTTILVILFVAVGLGYNLYQVYSLKDSTNNLTKLFLQKQQEVPKSKFPHKNLGRFHLTWYCPCEKCVGKKKIVRTATGTKPKANRTVAVDPRKIPLGSIIYIEGYGYFIAEDTGGAVKHNVIDIFVDSHEQALKNGRKVANVYLMK